MFKFKIYKPGYVRKFFFFAVIIAGVANLFFTHERLFYEKNQFVPVLGSTFRIKEQSYTFSTLGTEFFQLRTAKELKTKIWFYQTS